MAEQRTFNSVATYRTTSASSTAGPTLASAKGAKGLMTTGTNSAAPHAPQWQATGDSQVLEAASWDMQGSLRKPWREFSSVFLVPLVSVAEDRNAGLRYCF